MLLQRGNFRPDGELVERSKGDAGTDRNVFEAEVLDPFRLAEMRDVPWPQALAGRRVLIVTSMARDVARQYERYRTDGVSWFGDAELLPPNMHLLVVASPVTYRGRAAQGNWTRSLEELEKRVAAYQFDVALLSCGSYGLPLGHYITHGLGATAIYVGGALQLFFGLRGLRWKREIAPYESDAWACPERPKWDTSGMENYGLGPYWCPPAKGGS